MDIDWITLGAQGVNFLILVLLLRHFLYDRIVAAIDRREEEIRSRREEADRARKEAEEEAERHRRKQAELEEKREGWLRDAREAAERERQERLEEIRDDAERARERWREGLRREREDLLRELRNRVADATFTTVRHVLGDLADEDLQDHAVAAFRRRLAEAADDAELREALDPSADWVVRSAFELDDEAREALRGVLRESFGVDDDVAFETDAGLVLGLRLEVGDREVAWTAHDRMAALEEAVDDLLEERAGAEHA